MTDFDPAGAPFLQALTQRFGDPSSASELPLLRVEPQPSGDAERALRQARNRAWLRIGQMAAAGAPLAVTLQDVSDFADAAIAAAVDCAGARLQPRFGVPRGSDGAVSEPIILGMGKLGGCELNYSSDIDLIALYTATGETDGARCISNGEYFVKLMQEVLKLLHPVTEDGFVFRADLMLRPFGSASAIAISADAAEDYYQNHGREWERYALIKARPVAGNLAAGAAFLQRIRPFVYRRYLDFTALQALRDLKARIADDANARGVAADDLKIGQGGIRECEFIVQSFQLVRGGQDKLLRQSGWFSTLDALLARGLLPATEGEHLRAAYTALRRAENAVQIWGDQQTHAMPTSDAANAWCAAACGFSSADDWRADLAVHRARVATLFAAVLNTPSPRRAEDSPARAGSDDDIAAAFGEDASMVADAIAQLRKQPLAQTLRDAAAARLNALIPALAADAIGLASVLHPAESFARALTVVGAVLGRSTYLALLQESPGARGNLLRLTGKSAWITQELARHPVLLDQLLDARVLYEVPTRESFRAELLPAMAELSADDVEAAMDLLRRRARELQLRVAAADAVESLPLVKVSDALTWLAEAVLDAAIDFVWRVMVAAHGQALRSDGRPVRFVVIGYGKLAALEMGYGSDLDVVFVHDADVPDLDTVAVDAAPVRVLAASQWMARLVQKLMNLLTTQTHLGRAYEVDLALRPNGASGLPVVSLAAMADYQRQKAWTWEHQALTRARAVAGDKQLGAEFEAMRSEILAVPRDSEALTKAIGEMRQKMREHLGKAKAGQWDIKHGAGGLVDVEFWVAHAVLQAAASTPEVVRWPDVWRQLEALQVAGRVRGADAEDLLGAQRAYRARLHTQSLQGQGSVVSDAEMLEHRHKVTALWARVFGD